MHSRPLFRKSWLLNGVIVLVAMAGCASHPPPPPVAVEQQDWAAPDGTTGIQLLTRHYDLRVTTRDTLLQEYLAPFMETAFAQYALLIPSTRESSERLVVYLFGTRPEWADFTRRTFPAQAHTYLHIHAGGFMDHASATTVAYDLRRDRTLSLLAHEGLHQYVARHVPERIPAWLNEGLATQFEAFDLRGDRPVFTPRRNFLRKNHLRAALGPEGEFIPLSELLRMHAGEAVVETGQTVRTYYAQVWSMMLFLREGADGKYAEAFGKLLADAGAGRIGTTVSGYRAATPDAASTSDGEVIFRRYITEDLGGFMSEYRAFARHLVS